MGGPRRAAHFVEVRTREEPQFAAPRTPQSMRKLYTSLRAVLACPRGTAFVGYTSLILLFAMAAITMLGYAGPAPSRDGKAISLD
jgi:hypothetical protein